MTETASLGAIDRASILHPFSPIRDFASGKLGEPRIVTGASGIRIRDSAGRELIDGFSALYCVNVGYGRSEIADAIAHQAHQLAYYHTYAGHSNEPLIRLSQRLLAMAPGSMQKVFYGLSGSDANETQVKLVWYYNNLRGQPKKKKIISRMRGYHGCSVMAGSLTGMSFYHDHMDLPLPGVLHAGAPHHYWGAEAGESEQAFSQRRAAELAVRIECEGPETVAAFIGEPMLGTGGIIPPPQGYWEAVQSVLRRYDVLLIADEVISAFGRLGTMFGCTKYGIEPDLITVAKGLTSAYVPMSAALVGPRVMAVLEEGSTRVGAFSHGYTYSGHPLAAAAANAALDIVEREHLADNAAAMGSRFIGNLRAGLASHPMVGEIRGEGLLVALEFVADRVRKLRFDPALKVGARVSKAALERGLIARAMPHGDILGFAPPLICTAADVDQIADIAILSVREVAEQLAAEGHFLA
jgi:L-2,4-diaminobutyrate transaminase